MTPFQDSGRRRLALSITAFWLTAAIGLDAAASSNDGAMPEAPVPDAPALMRRDGVFCAMASAQDPAGCLFIMQVHPLGRESAWLSLTMRTRSEKGLPVIKIRLGHPAHFEHGELCVKAEPKNLRIEFFRAADASVGIRPDEPALDDEARVRARKARLRTDGQSVYRAITGTGHLLTFGTASVKPLRFVPLAELHRLRLNLY
ncbi:MAG: hypothetical protein QM740_21445 [Acidovorax sp.]